MSATVKPEYCKQLIEKHKCIFWTVKTPDKSYQIAENQDEISAPASADMLLAALGAIKAKTVLVELRPKARVKTPSSETQRGGDVRTGYFNLFVDLSDNLPAHERGTYSTPQHNLIEEIVTREKAIANLELEKFKLQQALGAAETQSSPLNRLIDKFLEREELVNVIADKIIGAFSPLPKAVAQPNIQAPKGLDDVAERLKRIDPDYINTLHHMANYMEANPGVFEQVKKTFVPQQ